MLELPFNRSGRLKNANLDVVFGFSFTSSNGNCVDEGMRFITLCTKLMVVVVEVIEDSFVD